MLYPQISLQKTLCLFFVILFHALFPAASAGFFPGAPLPGSGIMGALFSFALVPSFFFASGFLLEKTLQNTHSSAEAAGRRIQRLLVPWILMLLFWVVPLSVLFDIPAYGHLEGTPFWQTLLAGLQGRFTGHLWFLLVLFWASLFWILARPLLERAPRPSFSANLPKPDLSPWLQKIRMEIDSLKPDWINPQWFTLVGGIPRAAFPDLAGMGLAFVAAVTLQLSASNLTWYCLGQTACPVLLVYCGMLAYRHRDWLDAFLWDNAAKILFPLAALFLLLLPVGYAHFLVSWLCAILGALLTYQACLLLVRLGLAPASTGLYAFFETNAFRMYLFHAPTAFIVAMGLDAPGILPLWLHATGTAVLTFFATGGIVLCSRAFEQTQLPKIAAGMRPGN